MLLVDNNTTISVLLDVGAQKDGPEHRVKCLSMLTAKESIAALVPAPVIDQEVKLGVAILKIQERNIIL